MFEFEDEKQVLMNHIRDKLPDMKARLNTLMGQTQQELNAFGDSVFLSEGPNRGTLILQLMTQFVRDFVASIDGTSLEISTKELCGGARIYYIFNDVFGHALESINPTTNLTTQDIPTTHDSIRTRFRRIDRWNLFGNLDERALWRCTNLLHLQRRVRSRIGIDQPDYELDYSRYSNCDPELYWTSTEFVRTRSRVRFVGETSDQVVGTPKFEMRRIGL